MLTQEDWNNLNRIFALARQAAALNRAELINIINFEDTLSAKLSKSNLIVAKEGAPVETNTVNPDKPTYPEEKG